MPPSAIHFLMSFCCALLTMYSCAMPVEVKPNIIFIYTDDQAYWTTGNSGNLQAHTPNTDKLAAEAAVFTNSFVTTPVCSPARAALMTGRYASEWGIYDFIPQAGHRLFDEGGNIGLDTASITFSEAMKGQGYYTGLIGKWHLGDWTTDPAQIYHPLNHGFDYFMGLTGGGVSPVDPILEKDRLIQPFKGLTVDIITDEAIEFLQNTVTQQPFLLCINYREPHTKWLPVADEDWAHFENLDIQLPHPDFPDLDTEKAKRRMKEYLASVSGVDRSLGRIMNTLQDLNIQGNTIVIYSSDNGYNMGHNGIEHKGNGWWITNKIPPATENLAANSRPNMYDHSLRVPVIIKWPGVTSPGQVIHETMSSVDWFPTLLDMVGCPLPADITLRGRSVVPLLTGNLNQVWDNDFYGEYSMIHYSRAYLRCYRTPEWKLVKDFLDPKRDELYHLAVDPEEMNNLIEDTKEEIEMVKELLTIKMLSKMREIGDSLYNEYEPPK
ncbi:MAG: sulfatase-like hydrolase/transferase [Cyclobacteriaceae bacterium]|nr:sulfatase-like hydrolase/transferase [Cyclobacteriaceae bacterium]